MITINEKLALKRAEVSFVLFTDHKATKFAFRLEVGILKTGQQHLSLLLLVERRLLSSRLKCFPASLEASSENLALKLQKMAEFVRELRSVARNATGNTLRMFMHRFLFKVLCFSRKVSGIIK